ncbi:hypothetical protein KP509_10G066500 [Ceratopteris richardii]|uniref:Uncharacterized protein n=1 Tax=Ceratopteris richardii TaxID=49495 RepID=A0A8T2TWP5_CERRI|nr:hypothetical protein KP509_10G066500 [Ceratopteris richardii]
MAMTAQAGMATSKVIILVLGAGMAGPMILGKANLSDVISSLQGMVLKSEKNDASQNSGNEEIQAQIMRIAQELRQLYGGRQITVVNEPNQSNGLSSYIVPMAVVGAVRRLFPSSRHG